MTGQIVPGTQYRVVSLIGQGGMGSVYEVLHAELGKRFVLKALLSDLIERGDLVQRLRNEWRALGQLEHPNIVSVSDAGVTTNDVPYYVMERLLGETLGSRLKHGAAFHLADALRVAAEVLDGLQAAHEIGVVHRDVKPPNIFLMQNGQAKLLDFGIAKLLDRDNMDLTGRGVAIGTPRYMSPEQASGETVDGRADLYAVGLVLFEMLAGQGPFEGARNSQVFLAHLTKEPPELSSLVGGIPREVERFVARLLCKRPEDRPGSAGAAAGALRSMIRSYEVKPPQDTLASAMSDVLTPALSAVPDLETSLERLAPARRPSKVTERVYPATVSESGPTAAGRFLDPTAEGGQGVRPAPGTSPVPLVVGSPQPEPSQTPSRRVRTERIEAAVMAAPSSESTQAPPTRTALPGPPTPAPAVSEIALQEVALGQNAPEPQHRRPFVLIGFSAAATGALAVAALTLTRQGGHERPAQAASADQTVPAAAVVRIDDAKAPAVAAPTLQPSARPVLTSGSATPKKPVVPSGPVPQPPLASAQPSAKPVPQPPEAAAAAVTAAPAPPKRATPRTPNGLVGVPGWETIGEKRPPAPPAAARDRESARVPTKRNKLPGSGL